MKKHQLSSIPFIFCLLLIACNKEMISSTENISDKQSSPTGSIGFQYYKIDPEGSVKEQALNFTALYELPEEQWMNGYFWKERRWMSMVRTSSHSQYVRAGLHFTNVNLDSLQLPCIFDKNQTAKGRMGYYLGSKEYKDDAGNYLGSDNLYAADTHADDFTIVLLSKSNGRLSGTFSGIIKHKYDGDLIKIEGGVFEVEYQRR